MGCLYNCTKKPALLGRFTFKLIMRGLLCLISCILCRHWLFLLCLFRLQLLQSVYLHSIFFLYVSLSVILCFLIPDPYRRFRIFLTLLCASLNITKAFAYSHISADCRFPDSSQLLSELTGLHPANIKYYTMF